MWIVDKPFSLQPQISHRLWISDWYRMGEFAKRMITVMQTCSLRGRDQPGVTVMLCTWDSTRWRRRHVRHRRSWTTMLERSTGGRRRKGRRGDDRKERIMGGRRGGQALADRRLPWKDRRRLLRGDGLGVLREKSRGLSSRKRRRRSRGVL